MDRLINMSAAVLPVALALVLSGLLFWATGFDVGEVLLGVAEGAVTGVGSFWQTLRWAMPLVLIAVGFMFSLRAGEFNIGGQGQMVLGGLGTVTVALLVPGPVWLVLPLAIVAGMAAGTVWSLIPGWLKVRMGADEVIVTLMMNFIAALLVSWVTTGPLKDPAVRGESASTPMIDPALRLSGGDGMSVTLLSLIAVALIAAWVLAERTRLGLQLRYAGQSLDAARWQGMNVAGLRIWAYVLAGLFAGLAGAFEVLGPNGKMVTNATPTIAFTALIVTVVGGTRVPGIAAAALLFGGVQASILFLPIVSDLPPSGLRIFEGMIALLVTVELVRRRRAGG